MNALFQPMDARFQLVVAKKGIKKTAQRTALYCLNDTVFIRRLPLPMHLVHSF